MKYEIKKACRTLAPGVHYQQTREEVGKRLEDEIIGDKRGLTSPWMLQLQTPVDHQSRLKYIEWGLLCQTQMECLADSVREGRGQIKDAVISIYVIYFPVPLYSLMFLVNS